MNNLDTLFVCGSLSQGMVHYGKVCDFVEAHEVGSVHGSVYRLEVGYPIFLNEGRTVVKGHLLFLKSSELLFKMLDEFHGFSPRLQEKSLFLRVPVEVSLARGEVFSSVTYAINPLKLPKTASRLEDGDWEKSLELTPPLTEQLSERERTYICKLGASSGRDIVPINLDLYRDLMNKGLIVDKGRRLALTKLGQEVFRYLA